jgi:hypothetical protein
MTLDPPNAPESGGSATSNPTNASPPKLAEDKGIPEWLAMIALTVGLILTAAGSWMALQESSYTFRANLSALVACCGLAIVLVALGGKAVGVWGSWSVAGAAAAAPMLFLLQWQLRPFDPPNTMSYYVTFVELGSEYAPNEIKATFLVLGPDQKPRGDAREAGITRDQGGTGLRVVIADVPFQNLIILKMQSQRDNKVWESSAIHPNEGYMRFTLNRN